MTQTSLASARSGHLLRNLILILAFGTSMDADAFGDKASWREEVLQHDGNRLTVDRSQIYGSYPRIDSRERAVIEETWQFKVPGSGREVTWKNEFGLAPDKSGLDLLILGFVDSVPYIVAAPADCISYNKWQRPNPPYVVLKFDGQEWQRIPLSRVPAQFSEANVVVGTPLKPNRSGTLSVDTIKEENRNLPPYLRVLVRAPITYGDGNMAGSCPVMVYDGQGGWRSPDGPKAPHPIVAPSPINREK